MPLDLSAARRGSVPWSRWRTPWLALAAAVALFVAVYAPLAGRGFISDDFGWIQRSRLHSATDLRPLVPPGNDFFRPVVALTFAIDHAFYGSEPRGYGLTNLLLAVACVLAVVALLRQLGLPPGAAAFGGVLWLFNFHGINMAVLWLSGRTALLLTLFAVTTAWLVVRGRYLLALIPLALAMLSKEEAVVLPFLLGGWMAIRPGERAASRRDLAIWMVPSVTVLGLYLVARHLAGAMVPATAPSYYRLTFDPADIARNMLEYADRAGTPALLAALVAWLVLRPALDASSRKGLDWRRLQYGISWIAAGFAITIFLPVRSSLYVLLPSVGACLIASELCHLLWLRSSDRRRAIALSVGAVALVAASALHVARSGRWVELADLSTRVLDGLQSSTSAPPDGAQVVLHDRSTTRANLRSAFGTMIEDAHRLKAGRSVRIWVEPAHPELAAAGVAAPCPTCADLVLFVGKDGHVRAAQ